MDVDTAEFMYWLVGMTILTFGISAILDWKDHQRNTDKPKVSSRGAGVRDP